MYNNNYNITILRVLCRSSHRIHGIVEWPGSENLYFDILFALLSCLKPEICKIQKRRPFWPPSWIPALPPGGFSGTFDMLFRTFFLDTSWNFQLVTNLFQVWAYFMLIAPGLLG